MVDDCVIIEKEWRIPDYSGEISPHSPIEIGTFRGRVRGERRLQGEKKKKEMKEEEKNKEEEMNLGK